MTHLYVPFKQQVQRIVNKYFPPEISKRFTYRMTSEIWIPSMDETTFLKKKAGKESCFVLFDMIELFEVTPDANPAAVEVGILRSFKNAIQNGVLNIERRPEYTDNASIRRARKRLQEKKKMDVIESIKSARDNPMSQGEAQKYLQATTKKAKKLKELLIKNQANGI